MKLNRTGNAKKNMKWGGINKVVQIFLQFIIRTLIVYILGNEYLGLDSLFTSILSIINISELGISNAIVFSMYKPIANDNAQKICALLSFYRKAYRTIAMFITVIGVLIIPFVPHLIKDKAYPNNINIYFLFILYLLNSILGYLFLSYRNCLLQAHQMASIIDCAKTLFSVLQIIMQTIVLLLWKNYYFYVVVLLLITILSNLTIGLVTTHIYPQYKCQGTLSKDELKSVAQKVKGLVIYKFCGLSRNTFDSIFISHYLGLIYTAHYANYFYIFTALSSLCTIFSNAILAGVGNSLELDSREKNHSNMIMFDFLFMLIAGWISICLLCLYQPFITLWIGKQSLLPFSAVILLTLYFYISRMGQIRAVYADAAGLWWENRYRTFAEALMNLLCNYIFIKLWGINGVILASLVSLFLLGFIPSARILYKHYFTNHSIATYFWKHAKYFCVTFIVCSITYLLCTLISGSEIMIILTRIIVCCIVPPILYLVIYFKTPIFKVSFNWIKSTFLNNKKLS